MPFIVWTAKLEEDVLIASQWKERLDFIHISVTLESFQHRAEHCRVSKTDAFVHFQLRSKQVSHLSHDRYFTLIRWVIQTLQTASPAKMCDASCLLQPNLGLGARQVEPPPCTTTCCCCTSAPAKWTRNVFTVSAFCVRHSCLSRWAA